MWIRGAGCGVVKSFDFKNHKYMSKMANYTDLDIYKLAFNLSIEVHRESLKLPSFELYEQGGQIR